MSARADLSPHRGIVGVGGGAAMNRFQLPELWPRISLPPTTVGPSLLPKTEIIEDASGALTHTPMPSEPRQAL